MLVFTFPTISEKMDVMLSDDSDYILKKLTTIKIGLGEDKTKVK